MKSRKLAMTVAGLVVLLLSGAIADAQTSDAAAVAKTQKIVDEVVAASFPELDAKRIEIRGFRSRDTFFETRFSVLRFATFRSMRPVIFVNPRVFELDAPADGLRAIVAHELGHALYYVNRNRLRLFGLAALLSGDFNAGFERRTDLVAIERGYGDGLAEYRRWLYGVVDAKTLAEKKRDYFTPEEIALIADAAKSQPRIFACLRAKTPRTLIETKARITACLM